MIYLIDFENVSNDGLIGIENLTKDDQLIILYSEKTCKLSFAHHQTLESLACQKEYISVNENSKNALDFYLVTYLGYLISKNPSDVTYCIISKDTGFDAVINFWAKKEIQIGRAVNLTQEEPLNLTAELEKVLPDLTEEVATISSYISKYKTKQGINNALVKQFGSERGGSIYRKIKLLIKGKK